MADAMRFAYADPPYLGMGRLYDAHHGNSREYDDPEAHRLLIERLMDEFSDGWAMSLHEPSLRVILPMCPAKARVGCWVKPFASFKKGVSRAWAWEPVILFGGRPRPSDGYNTIRDWIAEPITLRKGLPGAKPPAVCRWILDWLNVQAGDDFCDVFPGTGVMGDIARERCEGRDAAMATAPLFEGLATIKRQRHG